MVSTELLSAAAPQPYLFTPDGVLFADVSGRVRVAVDGRVRWYPVAECDVLRVRGCGVLGMALDPSYTRTGHLYVSYTSSTGYNRISRMVIDRAAMIAVDEHVLVDGIPASDSGRNGGAMTTGPDGRLYVATGDAGQPALARSLASTAGKVLRIWADTRTCEIWASGLRDPLALRFTDEGTLHVFDMGPAGEERVIAAARGAAA